MKIKFEDIEHAFLFVCIGSMEQHEAFLCKETGKIYMCSMDEETSDELPEDIDDEVDKYIKIPDEKELGLGRRLVFNFAYQYLPDEVERIEGYFRSKGAYSKFRALIIRRNVLEEWYEFKSSAETNALREWCKDNGIEILLS